MNRDAKIYVAGHTGMVGSALVRALHKAGHENLICRTEDELDLQDQHAVLDFYYEQRPEFVFDAAARVGGILANNTYRGQFIYENLQIQLNLMHGAYLARAQKLLFLGCTCIYPKMAHQPIHEDQLLTGSLEPTHEPYAVAKIAGVKLCQAYHEQYGSNFISVVPTNIYGPDDNFDRQASHVLPALLRKFHESQMHDLPSVTVWGSGTPRREFLHVDDLADACLFLMMNYDNPEIINVGMGEDLSINELAHLIKAIVGYRGVIEFDASKPDGTPRKVLDVRRLYDLGWRAQISLADGIRKTYEWFLQNQLSRA